MIRLPGVFILLWVLMLPAVAWCADDTSADGNGDASTEQTGSDGKTPKPTQGQSGATEEEPDCE